ncbi:MAG: MFS transporter [Candidatus Kapabacteria bacterium]|nr:MFS transporter [Candidatus Kapabacteria bacterium]
MEEITFNPAFKRFNQLIEIINSKNTNWKKNLIYLSLAQFIAMAGMSSCVPFLPLFIRDLGITDMTEAKFWSGIIFSGPYFFSIITVPIWGTLGDKYGRKLMVVRAILGLAISMVLMGFSQNVYQLFFFRVLQGALSGYVAASLAFVTANTPKERSGYAIGILQSSQSAGTIVGPFIGGIISDLFGLRIVFFLVGALCLVSSFLIIKFVEEESENRTIKKSDGLLKNLKIVKNTKGLTTILLLIIISQAGILFTQPIFPYFVENLGAPIKYLSTITGLLVGIVGIFTIIFAPIWGRRNDRKDYKKTLSVSLLVSGVVILCHLFVPAYYYLFPLRIMLGVFFAGILPSLFTALSKRTDRENAGGLMGLASSANLFGALISFLLCGFVSSTLNIEWCFIISSLLLFIAFLINFKSFFENKLKISL